jgi:hypothetical protein
MTSKYTRWPKSGRKIDRTAKNIPTSSIARPSKFFPKWDFWFWKLNIPSGNRVPFDRMIFDIRCYLVTAYLRHDGILMYKPKTSLDWRVYTCGHMYERLGMKNRATLFLGLNWSFGQNH